VAVPSSAQETEVVNSLIKKLSVAAEDTNKVLLLADISYRYSEINPDEGIKYGNESLVLSEKLQWQRGLGKAHISLGFNYENKINYTQALEHFFTALTIYEKIGNKLWIGVRYRNIGDVYYYQANYPLALEYYLKGLKLVEEVDNKIEIARATDQIGIVYFAQGNYPRALENAYKAQKIFEALGDKHGIATNDVSIGNIYWAQNNGEKALEYFLKSLKISEEISNKEGMSTSLGNIGNVYLKQNKYAEALQSYIRLSKLSEEMGDKIGVAGSIGSIGFLYCRQGDYLKSLEYSFKSLKLFEEINHKNGMIGCFGDIGQAYYFIAKDTTQKYASLPPLYGVKQIAPVEKKDYVRQAIIYLDSSIMISKEIGALDNLQDNSKTLSLALELNGNYKEAVANFKDYIIYHDSVHNETKTKEITSRELQFDFDKKQDSIKLENEKKDLELQKEFQLKALRYEYEKKQAAAKNEKERQQLKFEQALKETKITFDFEKKQAVIKAENEKKQAGIKAENEKKLAVANEKNLRDREVAIEKNKRVQILWALFVLAISGTGFGIYRVRIKAKDDKIKNTRVELNTLAKGKLHNIKNRYGQFLTLIDQKDYSRAGVYADISAKYLAYALDNINWEIKKWTIAQELELLDRFYAAQVILDPNIKIIKDFDDIDISHTLFISEVFTTLLDNSIIHGFKKKKSSDLCIFTIKIRRDQDLLYFEITDNGDTIKGLESYLIADNPNKGVNLLKRRVENELKAFKKGRVQSTFFAGPNGNTGSIIKFAFPYEISY